MQVDDLFLEVDVMSFAGPGISIDFDFFSSKKKSGGGGGRGGQDLLAGSGESGWRQEEEGDQEREQLRLNFRHQTNKNLNLYR